MPPKAAPKGKIAFLKEESSPESNSLLISIAASTKKKAIPKLLIHSIGDAGRLGPAKKEARRWLFQKRANHPLSVELVMSMETTVHPSNRTPVVLLSFSKSLSGVNLVCLIFLIRCIN